MTATTIAGAKELANSLTFDVEVNGAWIFHLKRNVQRKFDEIRDALTARQTLLLRQVDVIATSIDQMCHTTVDAPMGTTRNASVAPPGVKFLTMHEDQLLSAIRNYGKISLNGINLALQDSYMRNEDYIMPANDHETMYKCLQATSHQQQQQELLSEGGIPLSGDAFIANMTQDDLLAINGNISHLDESPSIIEITLPDDMNALRKANKRRSLRRIPLFNLDRCPSKFAKATCTSTSQMGFYRTSGNANNVQKAIHCKPNITIDNCNGTINLHNISDLIINYNALNYLRSAVRTCSSIKGMQCLRQLPRSISKDDRDTTAGCIPAAVAVAATVAAAAPDDDDDDDNDDDNHNNNATSLTTVKRPRAALSLSSDAKADDRTKHCDFYSRLLYAIETNWKRTSITNVKNMKDIVSIDVDMNSSAVSDVNDIEMMKGDLTTRSPETGPSSKCFAFKRLGDLKITLKSAAIKSSYADDSTQPVQIEQWLTEIIRKTDLEPMQSIDFLEQSPLCYKLC